MVASTTVIIIIGFLIYMGLYWTYGKKIEKDVVKADDKNAPPSQRLYDGVDYVPAHKAVLFGHHFSSIAGAGPLVGPAMAMVWGWLPGLLWVWFGNVLIGSIHDYLALMASVRYDAKSVQFVATDLISKRTGKSFYWIVFFLLILVVAAFANVIGSMFARTPSIGSASIFMTFAAIILGVLIYRLKMNLTVATIIGIVLMCHRHLAGAPVPAAHELRDVDGHPVRLHHHRGIHPGEPPAAAAGLPELVSALLRHRHRLYRRHSDLQGDGGAGVLRLRARPAGRPAHALLARDPAGHRLRVPLGVPLPGGLGDVVQAAPEGIRRPLRGLRRHVHRGIPLDGHHRGHRRLRHDGHADPGRRGELHHDPRCGQLGHDLREDDGGPEAGAPQHDRRGLRRHGGLDLPEPSSPRPS